MRKVAGIDFGKDLNYDEGCTLDLIYASDFENLLESDIKEVSKLNSSGWKIKAELCADYYVWIEKFRAEHPMYGVINANLSKFIDVESEDAYQHFILNHPLKVFCYGDI